MTGIATGIRWHVRRVRSIPDGPLSGTGISPFEPTDVVIAEYPKSGETWLNFMLAEIIFGEPVGFESVKTFIPGVGLGRVPARLPDSDVRLWKTHEQHRREYRKAVYLVRHVGDVAVSYFNFLAWKRLQTMEFKAFLEAFLLSRVNPYGSWQAHVTSWLDAEDADVHVVRYEDLRRDTSATLRSILDFLGVDAQHDRVEAAIQGNTIEAMRQKEQTARADLFKHRDNARGSFIRKGTAGESARWLDADDLELIERSAGDALHRLGYQVRPAG